MLLNLFDQYTNLCSNITKMFFLYIILLVCLYLYTRAVKDIKIQFHTQLFKLYHSTTIKEHVQKNQSINIQIQAY